MLLSRTSTSFSFLRDSFFKLSLHSPSYAASDNLIRCLIMWPPCDGPRSDFQEQSMFAFGSYALFTIFNDFCRHIHYEQLIVHWN